MDIYSLVLPSGKVNTHQATGHEMAAIVGGLFTLLDVGDVVKTIKVITSGRKVAQTITYEKVKDAFGVVEVVSALNNKLIK